MKYQQPYQKLAKFYDVIYSDEFYHKYAIFIKELIEENRIRKPFILDIACGTGKLIHQLQKYIKDLSIEGLDSSRQMLKIARAKNKKVKYYNQTLTSFRTDKKYNIITCVFDSINYLTEIEDLDKAFKNVYDHLKDNRLFIFDFNTTYHRGLPKIIKKGRVSGYDVIYHNTFKGNYWDLVIEIKRGKKAYKEHHRERLYTLKEIKSVLKKNRLKIIKIQANLNNGERKIDKLSRLFVVARKINRK